MNKTDWTAEKVRARAAYEKGKPRLQSMLLDLAERIEADESAVPVRYEWRVFFNGTWSQWMRCKKRDVEQKLPYLGWTENVTEHRTLFTHPPAQPAQEQPGWKVPDAIVELSECRTRGWNDSSHAYRAGWNDCRAETLAASPTPPKEN